MSAFCAQRDLVGPASPGWTRFFEGLAGEDEAKLVKSVQDLGKHCCARWERESGSTGDCFDAFQNRLAREAADLRSARKGRPGASARRRALALGEAGEKQPGDAGKRVSVEQRGRPGTIREDAGVQVFSLTSVLTMRGVWSTRRIHYAGYSF